jgi:hypothetical protein
MAPILVAVLPAVTLGVLAEVGPLEILTRTIDDLGPMHNPNG